MFPDFDVRHYPASDDVSGVVLKRHNAVLIENEIWDGFDTHPCSTELFEQQSLNQMGSPLPGKCLHRASTQITVQPGNHAVSGQLGQTVHCDRASILHFPYRGFAQYQSKIRSGGPVRNTQLMRTSATPGENSTKLLISRSWSIFGKGCSDAAAQHSCRGPW